MDKVDTVSGTLVPVARNDVDTDQIIPARYLTSVSKEGYGEGLFSDLKSNDPEFSFNQAKFKDAKVLVVGENFGCGSSREHAVWALKDAGIDAVIGKSFADIFFSNSAKNGLLLVKASSDLVDQLLVSANSGNCSVSISLSQQRLVLEDGKEVSFEYDSFRKHCLLNGLDDLDYIFSKKDEVDRFMLERNKALFYQANKSNHS